MKPFGVAILNRDNALLAVAHFTTRHDFPIGEGGLKEALKALYFMCVCRYIYIMYILVNVTDPEIHFTIVGSKRREREREQYIARALVRVCTGEKEQHQDPARTLIREGDICVCL